MKKFEVLLLTIALFGHLIFFGFYVLTGRVYGGASSDNSYITFMMMVDIIPFIMFVNYLRSKQSKKGIGAILLVLFVILAILLIEAKLSFSYPLVKSFVAYTIPGALIGILFAKYDVGEYFAKWLEPVMLFLTIEGTRSMSLILALSYSEVSEFGIGVQSLSYYCAFAFALNLYFLLFGDEVKNRFKYTKTLIYKILSVILLVVQIVVSLSSGGRGGFVLAVVSAIVLILMRFTRRGTNVIQTSIGLVLIISAAVVVVNLLPDNINNAVSLGSERTFSYITKSGIDLSETSNRDNVYREAIKDIKRSPVIGYGLLMKGSFIEGSWPHNIVLEVLLQGGIIYLIVFLFLMFKVVKKLRLLLKNGHKLFIVPVALYPIVMLCFSGSYITSGLFFFVVTYILCCKVRKKPATVRLLRRKLATVELSNISEEVSKQ